MENTVRRTRERFDRQNTRKRIYCATPVGRRATADVFIKPLAEFLAGNYVDPDTGLPEKSAPCRPCRGRRQARPAYPTDAGVETVTVQTNLAKDFNDLLRGSE